MVQIRSHSTTVWTGRPTRRSRSTSDSSTYSTGPNSSSTTSPGGPEFDRIVSLIRAISDVEHSQTVERDREQLELINRALCHDLLNRLNIVRSRASLLDGVDADHDHPEVIEKQAEEMKRRVRTMEAFTDAIVGDGTHELQDRNLRDVVDEELSQLDRLHDAEFTRTDVPDASVRADERLSLVVENLLRNAIEHNDTDSPTVRVTGQCDDETVTLSIADDGPGIPDRTRDELFENGRLDADEGGFGLHFVKRTMTTTAGTSPSLIGTPGERSLRSPCHEAGSKSRASPVRSRADCPGTVSGVGGGNIPPRTVLFRPSSEGTSDYSPACEGHLDALHSTARSYRKPRRRRRRRAFLRRTRRRPGER
ncbi:MAG: sensor histidine kinase [Haloplanus sp.]